ncbi:unnamed protein product [Thelazia callipaeda]|uniref:Lipase_GDSL domain-containing protein n=1 Tax=Thelazia callipaeda TaxID=103827 RepID=A0A158RCZ8_THECL|nr:unnamed protein product [Thelazia callipaeda]
MVVLSPCVRAGVRDRKKYTASTILYCICYLVFLISASITAADFISSSLSIYGPTKRSIKDVSQSTNIPLQYELGKLGNNVKEIISVIDRNAYGKDDSSEEMSEDKHEADSGVSEETNPADEINLSLSPLKIRDLVNPQEPEIALSDSVSVIYNSFSSQKTFSCPKIKNDFLTGTNMSNLSPEDIQIIAAMGDSVATGRGLWSQTEIEFRGAAFPIGGDATIDGLVTIANILYEFNNKLIGVSHGMGTRSQLPDHQLNVAEDGATSSSMPSQARELVRRFNLIRGVNFTDVWTLVIITVGTEEICKLCAPPDYNALLNSLLILDQGIDNVFVIMVGPIHLSFSHHRDTNLLKSFCDCLREKSDESIKILSRKWTLAFSDLQAYFEKPYIRVMIPSIIKDKQTRQKFGLLTLPMLTIASRHPFSFLIPNRPLLNQKGRTYATKWLWNKLMIGSTYNLSLAVLSQDSYYCPSMASLNSLIYDRLRCPYFRTSANYHQCPLIRLIDVKSDNVKTTSENSKLMLSPGSYVYTTAIIIVVTCFFTVLLIGFVLYHKSKYVSLFSH